MNFSTTTVDFLQAVAMDIYRWTVSSEESAGATSVAQDVRILEGIPVWWSSLQKDQDLCWQSEVCFITASVHDSKVGLIAG